MNLDVTRGEIILVAFIFALIYGAGLLPKLITLLTGGAPPPEKTKTESPSDD